MQRRTLLTAGLAWLTGLALPRRAAAADLCGMWDGEWVSCTTGHRGPLHARIEQVDACHYSFCFYGRFFKVMPFVYRITLTVTGHDDEYVYLKGSRSLGPLLGSFCTTARASCHCFRADFSAAKDKGYFILTRRG